jgi:phosphoribosylaminoimidazole carboxylase
MVATMACAFSSAAFGATAGVSSRSPASRRALSRRAHRVPVRRAARPAAGLFDGGKGDRPVDAMSADGLPRTAKIGILGGGQLGRMLAIAGAPMGVRVHSLDPNPASPASIVAIPTEGSFQDAADVIAFAKDCDVVTVEIEHIDVAALRDLEKAGVDVQPCSNTLAIIQDKFAQKEHFKKAGVPLGAFQSVESEEQLAAVAQEFGFPLMLKSRRMAYDGKGNAVAKTAADVKEAVAKLGGFEKGLYCEKWVPFERELAVMVVRARDGETRAYPVTETEHVDNICDVTITPADVSTFVAAAATEAAQNAVASLEGAGVFGVELFLLKDGSILLNEIAPRPHNSGHYTIEATACCQYQSHLRAVLGWPLGDVSLTCGGAVMKNILGDGEGPEAMQRMHDVMGAALRVPGANVHWYDKPDSRKGRKMGHLTVTGNHAAEALSRLDRVMALADGGSGSDAEDASLPVSVGIIMGSDSDLPTMRAAAETLESFGVGVEVTVVSAHRTPERMFEYARDAHGRGLRCIIAGAGGAAHLPGMVAAMTPLPVIGVPVPLKHLDGVDSVHSILQMPRGVPVATVAIGNSTNAGLLAARIVGAYQRDVLVKMEEYQADMKETVEEKAERMETMGYQRYLDEYL